jgi:hypothetical protein
VHSHILFALATHNWYIWCAQCTNNRSNQVYVFLRSSNWDTRTAAGQAIDNIALYAPQWQPEHKDTTSNPGIIFYRTIANFTVARENEFLHLLIVFIDEQKPELEPLGDPGYLSFDSFDITKVLDNGTPLLASGGQVCYC